MPPDRTPRILYHASYKEMHMSYNLSSSNVTSRFSSKYLTSVVRRFNSKASYSGTVVDWWLVFSRKVGSSTKPLVCFSFQTRPRCGLRLWWGRDPLRLEPRCYYEEAKRPHAQPHRGNLHLPSHRGRRLWRHRVRGGTEAARSSWQWAPPNFSILTLSFFCEDKLPSITSRFFKPKLSLLSLFRPRQRS